jgi:outer membrane protein assembly factor BamA
MVKRIILSFLVLLLALTSIAQVQGTFVFSDSPKTTSCFSLVSCPDSLILHSLFFRCLGEFHRSGFLEARIDSFSLDTTHVFAFGHLGQHYQLVKIVPDSLTAIWLSRVGASRDNYKGSTINTELLGQISLKAIKKLEDSGYPFAQVKYSNSSITANLLSIDMSIISGPLITLDTLYIKGDIKLSRKYIEGFLGYSKGQPYNETVLSGYDQRLRSLNFVRVVRPTEVEFIPGKARVYTYLTGQNANQFYGLIGFASDNGEKPKIRFTGDVRLSLANVFRQGEQNSVRWQALPEGTQRLNIVSSWSYLNGTNFGLESQFNLYRRDTSYININPKVDAMFAFGRGGSLGIGFDYRSSASLSTSIGVENFKTFLYTLSVNLGSTPSEIFPENAIYVSAGVGVGSRQVGKQGDAEYNQSEIGEAKISATAFLSLIANRLVLKTQVQGHAMGFISRGTSQSLMENEMYRIGGHENLRGFNQESINTAMYTVTSIELQQRIQQQLKLFLFFDQGIVRGINHNPPKVYWPRGAGFGVQLATTGGVVSLSYALGQGYGESFEVKNSKIHVGFTALF